HCARVCFVHSTVLYSLLLSLRPPPSPTLFPYTTLFRSTESGQELYRVATDVLEQLQRATDQLRAERPARQLSITTTTGFASLWLIPRLQRFTRLYPDIDVRISATIDALNLERSLVDLAIRYCKPDSVPEGAIRLVG